MNFWHKLPSYGREMKNYRASAGNKINLMLLPEELFRSVEEGLHLLIHLLEILFYFLEEIPISEYLSILEEILEPRERWPLDGFPSEFLKLLELWILIDECIEFLFVVETLFNFLFFTIYVFVEVNFSLEHMRKS